MRVRFHGLITALATVSLAVAGDPNADSSKDHSILPDFSALSLDQLANVKVTSFTKKQQKLSQVAGAVYVITQEQIARSGLTSVPELLRLAPGIDVSRVNSNQWSISARSVAGIYSNKLLVLIDGRSIYSPMFSGVYWELGMPMLDDIERIEVIRGPGATVWGANAVLGVINIITKSSRDTEGATFTSGAGSSDRAFGSVRFGSHAGANSGYRVYFGGADNASFSAEGGGRAHDSWTGVQGGFRFDGARGRDTWTVHGDLAGTSNDEIAVNPSLATMGVTESPAHVNNLAANVSGEWRRRLGETGDLRVESYYDYIDHGEPQNPGLGTRTWNAELQYDFTVGGRHNISLGSNERLITSFIGPGVITTVRAPSLTYSNAGAFVQDEMHFAHDRLLFTAGVKAEHNHFGGWGAEPSTNLLWAPNAKHSVWVSAARALRTPSLADEVAEFVWAVLPGSPATFGLPVQATVFGSSAFAPESVMDYETGYRAQLSKKFSADISLYYDRLSGLRTGVPGNPVFALSPVPHLDVSETFANYGAGAGKGAEASLAWQVRHDWKLEGSYTWHITNLWLAATSPPQSAIADSEQTPHNNWRLQSYLNLSHAWKLDTFLYRTSATNRSSSYWPNALVSPYTRLDIRLGYRASGHWQLSLAGQNLLKAHHLEGVPELLTGYSRVNRSVYLKNTWQF